MKTVIKILSQFLKEHRRTEKPLLIGFSGGEDSLALVHGLSTLNIPLHLAHFDHKWRRESTLQASILHEEAKKLHLPFHSGCSSHGKGSELQARNERYAFFTQLYNTGKFEALLLAHHLNDQAETVLKRVLEGANLVSLKAMSRASINENIVIWRPFLSLSKKEIQSYLKFHHLNPLDDHTNRDKHFLRARMRLDLFPKLNASFGKAIEPPLIRLGHYAEELDRYLKKKTIGYASSILSGPFGTLWDFSPYFPLEFLEVRYLLKKFFDREKISVNFYLLEKMLNFLQEKVSNRRFLIGNQRLFIDRGKLFVLPKDLPLFSVKTVLRNGEYSQGNWGWKIQVTQEKEVVVQNWKNWWQGKVSLTLDAEEEGVYELFSIENTTRSMNKIWTNHKVPQILRSSLPLVCKKGKVIGDFLSGKKVKKTGSQNILVTISVISRE